MLKLIQTHKAGGDCSAPYDVEMDCPYTVGEFIEEILSRCHNDWGDFTVACGVLNFRTGYKDGLLQEPIPVGLSEMKVSTATAAGGYSNMDYIIKTGALVEKPRHPFDASRFHGPQGDYLATPNPMWIADIFVWCDGYVIKYNGSGEIEEVLNCKIEERLVIPVKISNIRPATQLEIYALKYAVKSEFGIDLDDLE